MRGEQSYLEEIQQGQSFLLMKTEYTFHIFAIINYFSSQYSVFLFYPLKLILASAQL